MWLRVQKPRTAPGTPQDAEDVFFLQPLLGSDGIRPTRSDTLPSAQPVPAGGGLSLTRSGGHLKKLPEFKSEDQERKFWATADSTEYVDWPAAKRKKLVNLKPTLKTISLRLPVSMIEDLKVLANRRDVPYQSLL